MPRILIALVIGIMAGYWIGYKDAYNGEKAIGSRIGIALGRVHANELQAERQRQAQAMRDSLRAKSGLAGIDSAVTASTIP